jgi:hypothetical protein
MSDHDRADLAISRDQGLGRLVSYRQTQSGAPGIEVSPHGSKGARSVFDMHDGCHNCGRGRLSQILSFLEIDGFTESLRA